jgi:hypothetical protein
MVISPVYILIFLTVLAFTLVYLSVKYLKREAKTYYGFDLFLPGANTWSVLFYLVILFGLTFTVYLMININLPLPPA